MIVGLKIKFLNRFFRSSQPHSNPKIKQLSNFLGFRPGKLSLYEQAFRHNSYVASVNSTEIISNERLEFLGDAILDSVVAEVLFMIYPKKGEGFLTEMRAKIVSREKLGELGLKMGLDEFIQYGKSLGNQKQVMRSLSGNALEALIGAIYLDRGYKSTKKFIERKILKHYIDINELARIEINFKSRLIEWSQKHKKEVTFELVEEKIQGKSKTYLVRVTIDGETFGSGEEHSKKKAEQMAAKQACEKVLNSNEQ